MKRGRKFLTTMGLAISISCLSPQSLEAFAQTKVSATISKQGIVSGENLTISAKSQGSKKSMYRFYILDNGVWKMLKDYSSSNILTWTPSKKGDYKFSIHIKDESSKNNYDSFYAFDYKVKESNIPKVTKVNAIVDKASVEQGQNITISATSQGSSNPMYRFYVLDSGVWKLLKDYSSESKLTWTPSKAGQYKFSVHSKDSKSGAAYDSYYAFDYKVKGEVVTKVDATLDEESPVEEGKSVTISASSKGSKKPLYKFYVLEDGIWKPLTEYTSEGKLTWTPSKVGEYKISIHSKDSNSKADYESYYAFNYSVKEKDLLKGLDVLKQDDFKSSMYMWHPETHLSKEETLKNLKMLRINNIYINAGWVTDLGGNYLAKNDGEIKNFIASANKNNITVEALYADPNWSLEKYYDNSIEQIRQVFTYNIANKEQRFSAVHLDVEPHLVEGWEGNKNQYVKEYIENMRKIKAEINKHNEENNDNLLLVVDLPFWIANDDVVGEGFRTEILNIVDRVNIMTYTKNNNDFTEWSKPWLEEAKGKNMITVSSEFDKNKEYDSVSLYELSRSTVNNYYKNSHEIFKDYKNSYSGIAFHDYDFFMEWLKNTDK